MGSSCCPCCLRRAKYGARCDKRVAGRLRFGSVSALRGEKGGVACRFPLSPAAFGKKRQHFPEKPLGLFPESAVWICDGCRMGRRRGLQGTKKACRAGRGRLMGRGEGGGAPCPVQSFWSREVMLTFSSMAGRRLAMGRRSCCMGARWRSVTVSAWSDWWSTVMQ